MVSLVDLSIVIGGAALLGIVARMFKQPVVLAYLITGILIGQLGLLSLDHKAVFDTFSELGIMFLLFLVGLEINYASLRMVGRASLVVGVSQIVLTFLAGFAITRMFDFSNLQAAYVAIALTLSSTVIVVKLLSEKRDLNSLYGKITIGLLLVQDFVAILLLVILAGVEGGQSISILSIATTLVKGIFLFLLMIWLGRRVLPKLLNGVAGSHELLFLVSLGWLFLVAVAVHKIGFSIGIGGFLAGLAMANSSEHFQIAHRVRPLRDFFILIFFVILGTSIVFADFSGLTGPIIALSLFVLIGNPLIVLIIMGAMGYRRRTGFLAGVTIGQVSEFSFILATLGLRVGHLTPAVVSLITAVGILTIVVSSYFITHAETIFRRISSVLSFFERRKTREEHSFSGRFSKPIIIIGAHRVGQSIASSLPKDDLLVIEFDPEVIAKLKRQGIDYIFGDIIDSEVFDQAGFENAKLTISTNPSLEDNLTFLHELRLLPQRPKVIMRAETETEAEMLYREGADYVLLPHFTSGQYLGKTIAIDPEMHILEQLRKRDLEIIQGRLHEEPAN